MPPSPQTPLVSPRPSLPSAWPLWLAGVAYCVLVLIGAAHHEGWFDEAQSWLLARDASIPDLLTRYMRYEGSPPLWQLLLAPLAKNGFPYTDLSFVSAALAILGVGVFLWRAPFPLWIRLLFPFSYFPLFQYAVVARSYSLLLPILCGIAALFPWRTSKHPALYCVLLTLLAAVSLHGALMAGVLVVEWFWTARENRVLQDRPGLVWGALLGFAVLYLLLILELRVPADIVDRSANAHGLNAVASRTLKQISEAFWGGLGSNVYRVFSTLVGIVVITLSAYWMRRSVAALFLIGMTVPLLLLAGLRQAANWHAGIIFLVWIFSLWIFFAEQIQPPRAYQWLQLLIGVILVAQVVFGLRSLWFDTFHVYSGSRAAAEYLQSVAREPQGKLYAVGFKTFALQPYFDRNLFAEQEHGRAPAFYSWKASLDHKGFADLKQQQPDLVIVGNAGGPGRDERKAMREAGYCETRRFQGAIWWKNAQAEPDTYIFMKRCP